MAAKKQKRKQKLGAKGAASPMPATIATVSAIAPPRYTNLNMRIAGGGGVPELPSAAQCRFLAAEKLLHDAANQLVALPVELQPYPILEAIVETARACRRRAESPGQNATANVPAPAVAGRRRLTK